MLITSINHESDSIFFNQAIYILVILHQYASTSINGTWFGGGGDANGNRYLDTFYFAEADTRYQMFNVNMNMNTNL